jgi:hypothetical protein
MNTCPRCHQTVELLDGGPIKAHRDNLTAEPCPTEGMTLAAARGWMAKMRQEMEARAAATLRANATTATRGRNA